MAAHPDRLRRLGDRAGPPRPARRHRVAPAGADPRPYVDALRATGEPVAPGPGPLPAATAEETECVLRWLDQPGIRLVGVEGQWTSPVAGAGRFVDRWLGPGRLR